MKEIEKVSSGKVKYNSLTGKSVIDPTITWFGPYMNKILGISNGHYIDTLLSKKMFLFKINNYQPLTTYSMASHVTYCILVTSINNKKRSHTQLDSRKQVIAFQDRVITINIKEAQHPLK